MENKMNLYEKMSAITNELGIVAKNLNVDLGKGKAYKAVQEKDVLDAIKPLEEKYRVYSYPKERRIIDNSILEKETNYGLVKSLYMRIETTYEFVNIDNPEEKVTMISYGDGIDTGDKAPGKAMTYSDKYSLLKAYKVATGDDPDKDASPTNGYVKDRITKEQIEKLKELVDDIPAMLNYYKLDKIEDMSSSVAEQVIERKTNGTKWKDSKH